MSDQLTLPKPTDAQLAGWASYLTKQISFGLVLNICRL